MRGFLITSAENGKANFILSHIECKKKQTSFLNNFGLKTFPSFHYSISNCYYCDNKQKMDYPTNSVKYKTDSP
jgi:hypothetical protein